MEEKTTYTISYIPGDRYLKYSRQLLPNPKDGITNPITDTSSICITGTLSYSFEETTDFTGTTITYTYHWTPLSSYLFEIQESIKNSVTNLSTTGKDSGNTVYIGSNSGLNLLTGISINPNNSSELTYTYSTVQIHNDIINNIDDINEELNNIKNSYISYLKKGNTTTLDITDENPTVNVITSFSKNESEKNVLSYNVSTINMGNIWTKINAILNYLDPNELKLSFNNKFDNEAEKTQFVTFANTSSLSYNAIVYANFSDKSIIFWENDITNESDITLDRYTGNNVIISCNNYFDETKTINICASAKSIIDGSPKKSNYCYYYLKCEKTPINLKISYILE